MACTPPPPPPQLGGGGGVKNFRKVFAGGAEISILVRGSSWARRGEVILGGVTLLGGGGGGAC